MHNNTDFLGYGLGLRDEHQHYVINQLPAVDWFEVITEDYLVPGGYPLQILERVRAHYPLVLHGVSLSIGGCDELNQTYLKQLRALAQKIQPHWISDHLCWTGVNGLNMHDLLPLPYTEEALTYVAARIQQVQEFLQRPLILENVSSYISYTHSHLTEWEFLTALTQRTGCKILLDINNIYVSAFNHHYDPLEFLNNIPVDAVQQFHLAGHTQQAQYIIDSHAAPVSTGVWQLFQTAVQRFGQVSTLLERDDNIPEFSILLAELEQARSIATTALTA